jgi:hypothetical protein
MPWGFCSPHLRASAHRPAQPEKIVVPARDVAAVRREPQIPQNLQRSQQHRQWRSARRDTLQVVLLQAGRRRFDEALDQTIMMLGRGTSE